ncbi:tyrosine-protein phosphatase [Kribbella sp. NPDC051587]|uniref:tyrosine-protein phosphatase n=1 Tax=Kribbella sp. NPDC051587 TaxID=3364119 RepID=UPI003791369D
MIEPMHWPNCRNVRDLGGLPINGGGTVRPGALLRSDNLDQLTPEGLAAVDALGIARPSPGALPRRPRPHRPGHRAHARDHRRTGSRHRQGLRDCTSGLGTRPA